MGIETLAAISIGTAIAGGGLGAFGALTQGKAASEAGQYKAAVGHINAEAARRRGQAKAFAQDMRTSAVISGQKTAQGASGVDVNSGSAVDVRASAAELGRLDALTILNNAESEAFSFETQANLDKFSGDNAKSAGYLNAFASILGGASSTADKWGKFKNAGVFT